MREEVSRKRTKGGKLTLVTFVLGKVPSPRDAVQLGFPGH